MAAGLGFKTFTTGEVLTAADTNGYLMQGVLVFASSAARAAAITSPQEGQYSYLKDTNSTEYYDGAAWIAAPIGDITGVTAGTGISGGGTSGTVTITNSMATEIAAKGDLIVGTGAATFDNLAVGTNGHVLTADSTVSPTGLKWAAPSAGAAVYVKLINAGSNYSTTSTTSVAVSTSNARITATPTGTTATVMLQGFSNNSGNTTAEWTISTGGTGTIMGFPVYNSTYSGTAVFNAVCFVSISGLTAGTSYNFDWFYKITGSGTTSIIGDTASVYPKMVLIC
jgi:hypothetical protein